MSVMPPAEIVHPETGEVFTFYGRAFDMDGYWYAQGTWPYVSRYLFVSREKLARLQLPDDLRVPLGL